MLEHFDLECCKFPVFYFKNFLEVDFPPYKNAWFMLITYVTNSFGKVGDSKSGSPQFESYNKSSEKYRLVLLDKALYQRVVLDDEPSIF